jgi:hypothetical protein
VPSLYIFLVADVLTDDASEDYRRRDMKSVIQRVDPQPSTTAHTTNSKSRWVDARSAISSDGCYQSEMAKRNSAWSPSSPIIASSRITRGGDAATGIDKNSKLYATVTRSVDSKARASSAGRLGCSASSRALYTTANYPTVQRPLQSPRDLLPSHSAGVRSSPQSHYHDDYRSTSRYGNSVGNSQRSRVNKYSSG